MRHELLTRARAFGAGDAQTWLIGATLAVLIGALVGYSWRLSVIMAAGVVLAVIPRWGVLVLGIVCAHTLAGRFSVPPLLLSDAILFVYVARAALTAAKDGADIRRYRPVFIPLIALIGWAWLSTLLAGSSDSVTSLMRVTLYVSVLFAAAIDARGSRPFLMCIAVFAAVEALFGILHLTPYFDGRLSGFYGDPQQSGFLMLAGFSAASLLPQPANAIVTILTGWGIFLTKTRGTWIAAVVASIVRFRPGRRQTLVGLAVVIGVAALAGWLLAPIATQRFQLNPGSLLVRQESWQEGIKLASQRPLLGYGWAVGGTFKFGPPPYNLFINVAASNGVPALGALVWFLAALLYSVAKSDSPVSRAVLPFLAAFITQSFGEMTVYAASPATILFFAFAGAGLAHLQHKDGVLGLERNSGSRPLFGPPRSDIL